MAASDSTIALPNPYTPMAFIPPELERKTMGLTYSAVGSLAVGFVFFSNYVLIYVCDNRFCSGISSSTSHRIINWQHDIG